MINALLKKNNLLNSLVSIIIPTYNRAYLISDTLLSIQKQSYKNWECIVVDDGSSDNTNTLIAGFIKTDSRFQYYKRPKHLPKGANACRNFGFDKSNGQYVNWFDSDDIMYPNKLELQIEALNKNPQSPYCICQSNLFDKESNTDLGLRSSYISSNNRLEDYCLYNIMWLTTAPLWRRDFLMKHQLRFDETLQQSQEYDFHIKALAISDNYVAINKPLLTLVRHKEAISNNIYTAVKLRSNLKVKDNVTLLHLKNFSSNGQLKWLEVLTLLYKDILVKKKTKLAPMAMQSLFKSLSVIKIPLSKKMLFKLKIVFTYLSFLIFKRGYSLVKPLKFSDV